MVDVDIHGDQHIRHTPLSTLSILSPYSGLIISVIFVIFFLIKQYIVEKWLLKCIYGDMFTRQNEVNRRSFVNNHFAGAVKFVILIVGVYPFIDVAFRTGYLHKPFAHGSRVTLGDILVVCANLLVSMYIFELIYRVKISPVSVIHHIGTILVAQAAIAISLDIPREKDASIEFILCCVWGAFDIVCEMLPHIAMILYRVYPDSHLFLSRLFMYSCFTTFGGTIFETIVTMYLFGSLWDQWQIAFKVATPILHLAFCAAQLHGSRIFFIQWRKQARFVRESKGLEAGGKPEEARSPQTTLEGSPQSSKVALKESAEEITDTTSHITPGQI